jgi:voltage-gated potassium channel
MTSTTVHKQRAILARRLVNWLELPMIILSGIWVVLLLIQCIWGLNQTLLFLNNIIWLIFVLDFLLEFSVAPEKRKYLKENWITMLAILVPAIRIFRIFRAAQILGATRGFRLVTVLTSLNRSMMTLGKVLHRGGFGYVLILTLLVIFLGAAGMYGFEHKTDGGGLITYGHAVWWTSMILTTIGSEYWPQTAEGRLLCFFLSLYGLSIFGYIAGIFATYFLGKEYRKPETKDTETMAVFKNEIHELRKEIHQLRDKTAKDINP